MQKTKKILVSSSFPPKKCGVGSYAEGHVLYLKKQGHSVSTLALDALSVGTYRVDLTNVWSLLKTYLSLIFSSFTEVHVHYAFDLYFPSLSVSKNKKIILRLMQVMLLLLLALKTRKTGRIIFHEVDGVGNSSFFKKIRGFIFSIFSRIEFHTSSEQESFLKTYPKISAKKIHVVWHGRFMQPKYYGLQREARESLDVPLDKTVFLCIGFIQASKGFDLAIKAFHESQRNSDALLYIVGSVRETIYAKDLAALKVLAENCPGVRIQEEFVSPETFDCWLTAADVVLLPYKEISSSGVGERALLLKRNLFINTNTNLQSQFKNSEQVLPFKSQEDLVSLFKGYKKDPNQSGLRAVQTQNFNSSGSILFVMAWFGPKVKGGAESVIFNLCLNLAARGEKVEVWTTASSSIESRNNDYWNDPADKSLPFIIRRFRTNIKSERLFQLAHSYMNQPNQVRLLGEIWKRTALYGLGMAEALANEEARFSSIHLCHYFGGSTHRLAGIVPSKTILSPFIHDEAAFYHPVMKTLFSKVRGVICNTRAEVNLIEQANLGILAATCYPIGNGLDLSGKIKDDELSALENKQKQILFIGRLIAEKNLYELLDWIETYNKLHPGEELSLVLAGEGPLAKDARILANPFVKHVGWVTETQKRDLILRSLAVVQPSLLESFSLVLVESWLMKTPVIVHKGCLATRLQVEDSHAGLAVSNAAEFGEAVDRLWGNRSLARDMGDRGLKFALARFTWQEVTRKFLVARLALLASVEE